MRANGMRPNGMKRGRGPSGLAVMNTPPPIPPAIPPACPDLEARADRWEREQAALAVLAGADEPVEPVEDVT